MTKVDAVRNIIKEACSQRGSRTATLRLQSSLLALGLAQDEVATIMRHCDYWNASDQPYPQYAKREAA